MPLEINWGLPLLIIGILLDVWGFGGWITGKAHGVIWKLSLGSAIAIIGALKLVGYF